MSIQIDTLNRIILDGQQTGLAVTQTGKGTIVYTPERLATAQKYKEHAMPHSRYSLAHDAPRPIHAAHESSVKYATPAGRTQFETDIRTLLNK